MKKVLFATLFVMGLSAVVGMKVQAQNKIGYIGMDELIGSMPEAKKADTTIEKYKQDLAKSQEEIRSELIEKSQAYQKDSATMTQAKKDLANKELNDLYQKFQNYGQEAQQLLQLKQQEVYGPIQKKAMQAVQDVAKENGFTYIMVKENLIYMPPADDILPLVKKKLGLN
jgi:outer membrane protein